MRRVYSLCLALALCLGLTVPALAAGTVAAPTNDRLTVDGVLQNPTVYKIDGSNYFKIRDLAAVLNGTARQFGVGYDGATNSVTATTGQGYVKQAGDLAGPPAGGSKPAAPSNDVIYVDGAPIQAEVYKIDGSNYFKLRDLGDALGFSVDWSAAQGMMVSTTGSSAPETPTEAETPAAATLANGKPVTMENVLAIMAEIEQEYPTGTLWNESETSDTAYNPNPVSPAVKAVLYYRYNVNVTYACGGFAAMVSDRIFGLNGAPMRELDDLSDIRPGDIVICKDGRSIKHVMVAASTVFTNGGYTGVYIADGNHNDRVVWPEHTPDGNHNVTWLDFGKSSYVAYTRYPAE